MKRLKIVLLSILFLYLLLMGILYAFQEKLIFLPEEIAVDYSYNFPFNFEEVNLKTADKQTINALHLKAKKPKGIILFFHGNKGNLIRWGKITSYFTQYQYDVFVIDYRGYGKSSGSFDETKMYQDALMSYKYLNQHFSEDQIIVYGRSLGTTFAIKVASENKPKHVVLEAPFYSLHNAANHKYKVIPKFLLRFKFNSYQVIPKISSPITIFHGTNDIVTPYKGSQQLFDLITSSNKELILLKEGTHHNVRDFKEYRNALKVILD